MKQEIRHIFIAILIAISGQLYAAEYYVSPDGNDSNPGIRQSPWKTLEYVSAQAKAGDTIIFLPGDYPGMLKPVNSGTAAQPIVFKADVRLTARLTGFTTTEKDMELDGYLPVDRNWYITVIERSYLRFEGLHVQAGVAVQKGGAGGQENFWLCIQKSDHITVEDCQMEGAPIQDKSLYWGGSVFVQYSSQIKFLDNVFRNKRNSDMIWVTHCDCVLFEGNEIGRTGHAPLRIDWLPVPGVSSNIVVRGNVFNPTWCRPLDFEGPKPVLFENNTIVEAFNGGNSATSTTNNGIPKGIIRFNQFYRNWGDPFQMAYVATTQPALNMDGVFYYNNIWDKNCRTSHKVRTHNKMIKNVFYENNCFSGNTIVEKNVQLEIEPYGVFGKYSKQDAVKFFRNIITGDIPGLSGTIRFGDYGTPGTYENVSSIQAKYPDEFAENLDVNPGYEDAANYNYAPVSGSAMIDAGRFFAVTTDSGKNVTSFTVNRAGYFYDGFGIEGEKADWIRIGDTLTQITDVNYATNVITVSTPVTFTQGTNVSLLYGGSAPDIGVYEVGNGARPSVQIVVSKAHCLPGTEVALRAVCRGISNPKSYKWHLGDGSIASGSELRHTYNKNYNYPIRLKVTDANGNSYRGTAVVFVETPKKPGEPFFDITFDANDYDWWWKIKQYRPGPATFQHYTDSPGYTKVWAPKDAGTLVSWVHPPAWKIDDYPSIRFRIKINKGAPLGVYLMAFCKRDPGMAGDTTSRRVCIAGTPNAEPNAAEKVDGFSILQDDEQWHEYMLDAKLIRNRYPGEVYLEGLHFEACPQKNVKKDQWYELDYLFIDPQKSAAAVASPEVVGDITVKTDRADAVYEVNSTAVFEIAADTNQPMEYVLSKDGQIMLKKGTIQCIDKTAKIEGTLLKPGFLHCEVSYTSKDGGKKMVIAAAAFEPTKINPAVNHMPADFDQFWQRKKQELAAIPMNPIMTPEKGVEGLLIYDVNIPCLGVPVRGYYVKPANAAKGSCPAIAFFQGAGVSSASKALCIDYAKKGFIAIEINAHGVANGHSAQYYKNLYAKAPLKGYHYRGREDANTCYFTGMFLRVYRALEFLKAQPQWDGKHLVAYGSSQGGAQAIAAAGLDKDVTFLFASVPGMCDHGGEINGWPNLVPVDGNGRDNQQILNASKYVDSVNFAEKTTIPALFTVGFIDTCCQPTSIYAAYNTYAGPKEIATDPLMNHAFPAKYKKLAMKRILKHTGIVK